MDPNRALVARARHALAYPGDPSNPPNRELLRDLTNALAATIPSGPVPVAPEVIRLHQAWEGASFCLHCGTLKPWSDMEVCPRRLPGGAS